MKDEHKTCSILKLCVLMYNFVFMFIPHFLNHFILSPKSGGMDVSCCDVLE